MAGDTESAAAPQASGQQDATVTHDADRPANAAASLIDSQILPLRTRTNGVATNGSGDPDLTSQQSTHGNENVNKEGGQDDLEDQDHGIATNVPPTQEKKKRKKKKSRKPGSQRGLDKPTGFEDFFADAPMTPEEYAEDQELYDRNLHFVDRILIGIARFERTRKLTPERRDIFYKYLAYGGLTVGPNVGQGGINTGGLSKTETAQALSQAFISEDKRDLGTKTSLYEVDFLVCIKGFLSRRTKSVWGLETKDQVDRVCTTLERFMDYLLQHDVCPEFKDDLLASRAFCRKAAAELWDMAEATRRLPGEFNIACSTLFDGSYSRNYDGETWWGKDDEEGPVFVGLKPDEARQIVSFGVAGSATEQVYMGFLDGVQYSTPLMLDVINIEEHAGFEITQIEAPTRQCKQIYTSQSSRYRPVGRVRAKPWRNPDARPEDLTAKEREAASHPTTSSSKDSTAYVFLIESILQDMLRVGTKVEATIRTLGCGIMFFDDVVSVYPTFDEFLPNELMVDWKSPKPVKGAMDYISEGEDSDGEERGEEEEVAKNTGEGTDPTTGEKIGEMAKEALAGVMARANGGTTFKDDDDPY